jgi:hypothetical protein
MILKFRARGESGTIRPWVQLKLTRRDDYPDDTEGPTIRPDSSAGDNSPSALEIINNIRFDTLAETETNWRTYRLLFNTFGAETCSLKIGAFNKLSVSQWVDIDDVSIAEDTVFYKPYPLYQGQSQNYNVHVTLHRQDNGQLLSIDTSRFFYLLPNGNTPDASKWWNEWCKAFITKEDLNPTLYDYADVVYTTYVKKTPTFLFENESQSPYDLISNGSALVPRKDCLPILTTNNNVVTDLKDQFLSSFRNYNLGDSIAGYYYKENEIHAAGWTDEELAYSGSLQQHYGEFLTTLYQRNQVASSQRLFVFSDMFDPNHNARRWWWHSTNGFGASHGWRRPTGLNADQIPGIADTTRLTYILWNTQIDNRPAFKTECLPFWEPIVTSNKATAILGYGQPWHETEPSWQLGGDTSWFHGIIEASRLYRENGAKFTGGLVFDWKGDIPEDHSRNISYPVYYSWDATSNPTGRGQWLCWLWKYTPMQITEQAFSRCYAWRDSIATIKIRAFPVNYRVVDTETEVDSVVLQYRIKLATGVVVGDGWQTQRLDGRCKQDSLYEYSINLPNDGGVVEYRTWAFDHFGAYGAVPDKGTKYSDPDAGERYYFTFERRKTTPITSEITFYTPGVITQPYTVHPNGKITVKPLPGFHQSTLYVGDNKAALRMKNIATGATIPTIHFAGLDTSVITVAYAPGVSTWGGITDSIGRVILEHVTFKTGKGSIELTQSQNNNANSFKNASFDGPITVKGPVSITGDMECASLLVDSNATLTILPGAALSFEDSARVVVQNGGKLIAVAPDTLPITFKAKVDSIRWLGIQIARNASDSSQFENCTISGADAGVLTDRRVVSIKTCKFDHCQSGILAINGGHVLLNASRIADNRDGIILTNLSSLDAYQSQICSNRGTGLLALSRSTIALNSCVVDSNGGDGLAGGIGSYTGSTVFMNTTSVDRNYGSGLAAYHGAVVLNSVRDAISPEVNWHGNSIATNHTVPGEAQITLHGRVGFGLYNGHNRIADSSGTGKLVNWEDHPTRDWWKKTYWGSTDTAAILSRLPSNVVLGQIDNSWTAYPSFTSDTTAPDSLIASFINPYNKEISGSFSTAESMYKSVITSTPRSDWAMAASDRLVSLNLASGGSFNTTRTYLQSIADTTTDANLKKWLKNGIGWCWAELDSFSKAHTTYDSLNNISYPRLDQVEAQVQKHMVAVRQLAKDSVLFTADQVLARIDTIRSLLLQVNRWTQPQIMDSVVMYAPCYVDTTIDVYPNAKLYIRNHPGVHNATVQFGKGAIITVNGGINYSIPAGELHVFGDDGNPVTLDSRNDTVYAFLNVYGGKLLMNHAKVMGRGICTDAEIIVSAHEPIVQIDSSEFSLFDDGLYFWGTDTSSYLKNSTLSHIGRIDNMGTGYGSGIAVIEGGHVRVENCDIADGEGIGIFNYLSDTDVSVIGTKIHDNASYGVLSWEGANLTMQCSEIYDNGDTLPELKVEDGFIDLSDGHNVLSDSAGTLVETTNPAMVDLGDGQAKLELTSGTGKYLVSGTPTTTWGVSMNTWIPVDPADSTFYSMLSPTNPAKWLVDTSLATFIGCDESSSSSAHSNSYIIPGNVGVQSNTQSFVAEGGDQAPAKGGYSEMQKGYHPERMDTKQSEMRKDPNRQVTIQQRYAELAEWRLVQVACEGKSKNEAAQSIKNYVQSHQSSEMIPNALVELTGFADRQSSDLGISDFLVDQARLLTDPQQKALVERLSSIALSREGRPGEALKRLEVQMEASPTPRDSIRALIDAMGVCFFNRHNKDVMPKTPQIRSNSLPDLIHKVTALVKTLHDPMVNKGVHSAPIPTSYCLYQNFPNPFNPNTEIRFDLPENVRVELKIFNVLGQEVARLVDDVRPAGAYRILWDSKSATGTPVASGMYVYQIKAGKFTDAKKMMLIR